MTLEDIGRISLQPKKIPGITDEMLMDIPDIHDEVESVLGYKRPERSTSKGENSNELFDALQKLEIEILNTDHVLRYQLEMQHKAEKAELEDRINRGSHYNYLPGYSWNTTKLEAQIGETGPVRREVSQPCMECCQHCRVTCDSNGEAVEVVVIYGARGFHECWCTLLCS